MNKDNFIFTQNDREYLEEYCEIRSGSFYSKIIKALLLIDEKYAVDDIEKILSIKIATAERCKKIYAKYGLVKLLEDDVINRYDIIFEMKQHGWMNLIFEFVGLNINIKLSNVFDPIPDLLNFITGIKENRESAIIINEEGRYKKISLNKTDIFNKGLYELKIIDDGSPFNIYEFKTVIHREIFLYKFVRAFKKLADENMETKWVGRYNLSKYIQDNIFEIYI